MKTTFHKTTAALSLAVIWAGVVQAGAQSNEELKAMIRELDQKVRMLERKLEDRDASKDKSQAQPTVSIGSDGFVVRSSDTNFVLRLGFHLQAEGRFYPNDAPGA